ncbi:hypothetical protein Isop_2315 [Isosphaera pallida ATCC 43644]|jgi:hypothetical protein|uniref:Uncharacterized protein n=1 Tax=Isosphaera pallida (strain ATCC 43644 / DSM 9630 / IS1B) TaxID=575540 RepID=E8R6I2_ISOPI|nr:hypothetical protein Isop_2315 [Isosphaera pallida ATCC 43644]
MGYYVALGPWAVVYRFGTLISTLGGAVVYWKTHRWRRARSGR